MPKERVDVLAYKQGLFDTREQAKRGVMAGLVVSLLNGERYDKPGEKIDEATELKLKGEKLKYVSRGGLKLEKALEVFGISVSDMTTIDIGASTGGFTDVMLQAGARLVYAVDVGTNQLVWKLRQDQRVRSMEQYNFRYAQLADFMEGQPSFASIDVSFISLNLILPALQEILADKGQVVALVKPQFEAGREQIGKNGIVKDAKIHEFVLKNVMHFAQNNGFTVKGLDFSPIQGGHGNIEFLAHLEKHHILNHWIYKLLRKSLKKHIRNLIDMKKNERLDLIKKMVLSHDIETQHELLALLKNHGLELTQATISRDMNEIGIVKIPSGSGPYIYGLSQDSGKKISQRPVSIRSTILQVSEEHESLKYHLYLKVTPGNAMLIKRYLFTDFADRLFSVIADDDSIQIISKTPEDTTYIRQQVQKWMKDK